MKVIFFTTLLLFSINGFAFNWKKVAEGSMGDLYVDVDNIKKRNGLVYYWVLSDYFEPHETLGYSDIQKDIDQNKFPLEEDMFKQISNIIKKN